MFCSVLFCSYHPEEDHVHEDQGQEHPRHPAVKGHHRLPADAEHLLVPARYSSTARQTVVVIGGDNNSGIIAAS